jgi:hypothetical protein
MGIVKHKKNLSAPKYDIKKGTIKGNFVTLKMNKQPGAGGSHL